MEFIHGYLPNQDLSTISPPKYTRELSPPSSEIPHSIEDLPIKIICLLMAKKIKVLISTHSRVSYDISAYFFT